MRRYENEPICGACNKKIELGMPITSLGDDVLHRWCYEALLRSSNDCGLRALEDRLDTPGRAAKEVGSFWEVMDGDGGIRCCAASARLCKPQ